jgi:capsular exopolysaccharide synthesis family protein
MATEIHKLETRLWHHAQRDQLKIFLVTSAVRGEGKSTIVAYLSTALALHPGRNILAMDLDFRGPTLNSHFDLEFDKGLEDVLRGECRIADAIVHSPLRNGRSGLDLIFPARGIADPQVLLHSPQLLEVFQSLRASYDLIVLDSPPLIPVADATALIPHTDAVILAVMAGVTTKHHFTRARELCLGLGANILGIVVGNVQEAAPEYMDSSYFAYQNVARTGDPRPSRQPDLGGTRPATIQPAPRPGGDGARRTGAPEAKGEPDTNVRSESKR